VASGQWSVVSGQWLAASRLAAHSRSIRPFLQEHSAGEGARASYNLEVH